METKIAVACDPHKLLREIASGLEEYFDVVEVDEKDLTIYASKYGDEYDIDAEVSVYPDCGVEYDVDYDVYEDIDEDYDAVSDEAFYVVDEYENLIEEIIRGAGGKLR